MVERDGPHLYTIPAHRAFADALATGLMRRFGTNPLGLARGTVLVPSNRAKRTITDAFVRASGGGGLLLPRLIAIGGIEEGEADSAALDPVDDSDPVPPAVSPLTRRMVLARLVSDAHARGGGEIDTAEAVRQAGDLGRTLDQLLIEEVAPRRLKSIDLADSLSAHWQRALAMFGVVLDHWPTALAELGCIDLAERRAMLLARLGERWRRSPPDGFVCAAGVTTAAPAVARLLRVIADLPHGMVVLPGLDTEMPEAEWQALGPHAPDPVTGMIRRSIETHPQFQLKLLLERMSVNRSELATWRDGGGHDSTAIRGRAVNNALSPAEFTAKWTDLPAEGRRLSGVRALEVGTPAEEAQAIALALRQALETPGRTAALVTPDRALARRVAAHCARWGIEVDDSAGRPLSILPSGTLLTALAEAAASRFAPMPLLALLKHPLVRFGEDRLGWLEGARALDRALRGPRPAPGLAGTTAHLAGGDRRERPVRRAAAGWWPEALACLTPLEEVFDQGPQPLATLLAALRNAAQALSGDAVWAGVAGRAAATLLADLEVEAAHGPPLIDPGSLPVLLRVLMDDVAVRPPQGGHPRLAIYGQIEARLQTPDLMIVGGMNEGVWPSEAAPDPWLAPRIRVELGLPALDRRVGMAAHDLASALGAPEVLLTRALRDSRAPTIASRFWLRLEAMSGGLVRDQALGCWARMIDDPGEHQPERRPEPSPPIALRPTRISVTEVDRLKADPYAFYARRVLGLSPLEPVDADPSAAWRGTAVHGILEVWAQEDDCATDKLHSRALAMLRDERTHPMMRALWQPRLMQAIDWIVEKMAEQGDAGRIVLAAEHEGMIPIAGVELRGKFDRLDRLADGGLAIVDYKTGKPPSPAAVSEGFSLQLGLLGLIAERGGFAGVSGIMGAFEYWSLAKYGDSFGKVFTPVAPDGKAGRIITSDFTQIAERHFVAAAARWLTGDEAFTAKLKPEYAPFTDYDQLMRRDEWYGRDER